MSFVQVRSDAPIGVHNFPSCMHYFYYSMKTSKPLLQQPYVMNYELYVLFV